MSEVCLLHMPDTKEQYLSTHRNNNWKRTGAKQHVPDIRCWVQLTLKNSSPATRWVTVLNLVILHQTTLPCMGTLKI